MVLIFTPVPSVSPINLADLSSSSQHLVKIVSWHDRDDHSNKIHHQPVREDKVDACGFYCGGGLSVHSSASFYDHIVCLCPNLVPIITWSVISLHVYFPPNSIIEMRREKLLGCLPFPC